MLLAAGLAGVGRGGVEPHASAEVGGSGLVRVTIGGASAPTAGGCSVFATPEGLSSMWVLSVPAELCPLAASG